MAETWIVFTVCVFKITDNFGITKFQPSLLDCSKEELFQTKLSMLCHSSKQDILGTSCIDFM